MKRLIPARNKIVNEIENIDYCGTTGVMAEIEAAREEEMKKRGHASREGPEGTRAQLC